MQFPILRPRRLRQNENFRRLVRETKLSVDDLIYPLFVVPGKGVKKEIPSMPGCYHFSIDKLVDELKEVRDLGIPGVILFGIPENKDEMASGAYAHDGIIQKALQAARKSLKDDLLLITDVCLCEYMSHGHCGVVHDGQVDNDETLELLAETSVSHARAGAHMVAPSDMMDGRVAAIRDGLDEAGFDDTPIMSYAAKYASAFYGPFRDAAESAPQFGDRRAYQMDPPNAIEAMKEVEMDVDEGADIIMIKPALPYLDIIYRVKQNSDLPVAAYNVSGEYSMLKAAGKQGWLDEKRAQMEALISIKRAGADIILTYYAKEAARELNG